MPFDLGGGELVFFLLILALAVLPIWLFLRGRRRGGSPRTAMIGPAPAVALVIALVTTAAVVGLGGVRTTPAPTPAVTPTQPSLASSAQPTCPACRYDDGSGAYRLDGVVRDTSGAPVAGARVAVYYNLRVASAVATTTTDETGAYALGYELSPLPAGQFWGAAYLVAEKAGYEADGFGPGVFTRPDTSLTRAPDGVVSVHRDLRLHATVALAAGASARLVIHPDDPTCLQWFMDKDEWPCRIVRVTAPAAGRLTVDVSWTDETRTHELGLQLVPQVISGLRSDPPCCEAPHESIDVAEGEVIQVQVLFLNEGFRVRADGSALKAARGPQAFVVSTSFVPK
jgi:hypothetical protein